MRTTTETDVTDYTWTTVQDAARRLGVKDEHVLALGAAGELEIVDLRVPGARRGVYRVNPESVTALVSRRKLTPAA